VCMYLNSDKVFQTPVLQISYQEFEEIIERNENS